MWLALAILLVLAALLLSLLRYSLPYLPDLTAQLQSLVQQRYGDNISFDHVSMDWAEQGISLVLNDMRFSAQEDAALAVDVKRTLVVLDVWQSLLSRQIRASSFVLDGVTVNYDMRAANQSTSKSQLVDNLATLFLEQLRQFSVINSEIRITNLLGERNDIRVERLSWLNQQQRHQGVGQLRIEQLASNGFDFNIELQGNEPDELVGQLYASANNLDVSPWLEEVVTGLDVEHAETNFTGWLTIENGEINHGLLQLGQNNVQWRSQGNLHRLQLAPANVVLQATADGWLLGSDTLQFKTEQGQWQLAPVALMQQHGLYQLQIEAMPVSAVAQLSALFGDNAAQVQQWLQQAQPQGWVDVNWQQRRQQADLWYLRGTQLGWQSVDDIPGADELQSEIWFQNPNSEQGAASDDLRMGYGSWRLQATNSALTSRYLDSEVPVIVDRLALTGQLELNAEQWLLRVTRGELAIADAQAQFAGRLWQQPQQPLQLALRLQNERPLSVATARQLLPVIMGQDTRQYLRQSLQAGDIQTVNLSWRGPVDEFPYAQHQGVFNGQVRVDNLTFKFQPDWPALIDTTVLLDFYNERLSIYSDSGDLVGIPVGQASAVIADLGDSQGAVEITAETTAQASAIRDLMQQSSLADSVGAALDEVVPEGPVSGQVKLHIPFSAGADVAVSGSAQLRDNRLYVSAIDTQFEQVSGRLSFAQEQFIVDDLVLHWQGMPIQAKVNGKPTQPAAEQNTLTKNDVYQVSVVSDADWQTEPLYKRVPELPLQPWLYGAVNWHGELQLMLQTSSRYRFNWDMQTDLTGLQSTLPAPLNKEFGDSDQLRLTVEGDEEHVDIRSDITNRLRFSAQLKPQQGKLAMTQGRLHLGVPLTGQDRDSRARFLVTAGLVQADVSDWYQLLDNIIAPQREPSANDKASMRQQPSWLLLPDAIHVQTPRLSWLGQQLTKVDVRAWPVLANPSTSNSRQQSDNSQASPSAASDGGWQIELHAEQTDVDVSLASDFFADGITINANYLNLSEWPESFSAQAEQVDTSIFKRLPPVQVFCRQCAFQAHDLGQIRLRLTPIQQGVRIQQLSVEKDRDSLQAEGLWYATEEGGFQTYFKGQLDSADIGDLFSEYDLTSVVRDSPATISFDLNWAGLPHQVSLGALEGTASFKFGNGYLAEVNDGARIFSILSLDSILRKLTLDFRDIFSQGMFYTDFSGDLSFAGGVVSTDNTRMQGAAGDMSVQGTTNLNNNQLNYSLSYVPKVTSSLPIIVAWMVNPPSGLAALFLDKVLHDAQVISKLEYRVTGTIEKPVVEEVARDSKKVELPAQAKEAGDDTDDANNGAANEQPSAAAGKSTTGQDAMR
ncbi:hypothetical protein A10D4_03555 [Idiomarina xiamenensis 10-D-4]|uniref:YhdP central domain-containing protein n=2 Tax=Idiomarina xiamenensis TaxID=1207041 RepID=K2KSJ6_9GAMM|nr:hypothetical protein A10D4_03555 [Idiomarina xiamenensis 10-D-4]